MRTLGKILLEISFVLSFAYPALAGEGKAARETIDELMKLPEPHLSIEAWRAISPEAPKILMTLFRETNVLEKKVKLVRALSNYDDVAGTDFLKEQAMHGKQIGVRRAAIRALAISQGLNQKNFLEKFLKSEDSETRFETARAFQNMHDVDAERILNQYLKQEKSHDIVKRLKSNSGSN